jgi:Peptidase C39 family/Peptidase_C39 like family
MEQKSRARRAPPGLGFEIELQPDNVSCGPACLAGVYRYYGDTVDLATLRREILAPERGGTFDVFLANHALHRGYQATIFSYNLQLFDPTWFDLPAPAISARLGEQARHKRDRRLQLVTRGYQEFLALGGKLRLEDLQPSLLRRLLNRRIPIVTGLSATYLYRVVRDLPETNEDDDIRGEPVGHFVVLTGYDRTTREVLVADPYRNPNLSARYYAVKMYRLIGAILLGISTYDANLLVIEPKTRLK